MTKVTAQHKGSPRPGLRALGCLLLVGSCLALSLTVAKLADDAGAPRISFLMVAMAGAGLVLMGLAALRRRPLAFDRRALEYSLVAGALLALPNALAFVAIRHVGAGFISLSFAFPILITWVLAVCLRLERLRLLRLSGVVLGLCGGLVLAAAKAGGMNAAPGWALLVMAMPLVIALGNIYRTLRWPEGGSPLFLAALMLLGGAVTLLPLSLALEPGQLPVLFSREAVTQLLALEATVFTVLYLFYFVLQKLAGPVYLSQIGAVAAVVGTLIAVLALGEAPPPNLGLAALLVIVGSLLFQRGARAATLPTATTTT
ncbi:DMT family transporter [Halomonas pacifica]|uniref:Transporter n=1 Tax=Bisbaumannia pacifica TaxID=77098 RepID=A0A510X8B5_9GAMM|nr:DMT family transporter [Halomonas pacifica]MBH8579760.1 DMT family transporter [Halomonas pacifica]MDC8803157.1 DMT family transporter [Halomonas pacifica]GEK46947.1 transporter [Halomonas pacifica]